MRIFCKFIVSLALSGAAVALAPNAAIAAPASQLPTKPANIILHVATNGNDNWSGQFAAPNAVKTDGPLASLQAARDRLRQLRQQSAGQPRAATIWIHQGIYRLEQPLVIEPVDSGSVDAPVVYAAFPGEKPILSGGHAITGFKQNGKLWEAIIPEVRQGQWYFRQLWVNGQRRQRARSPNEGYHRIARLVPGPPIPNAKPVARDRFIFAPGDIKPWARLNDVNVILMHSWETSIHPISAVDTASNMVIFAGPMKEWWSIGYWEDNQRYYVENALELLDQPGEWYLDRESGKLYYWPMPGEKLGRVEVVAPRLTEFLRITGNPDRGEFVSHVTFRGLTFHHADWKLDPKGNSSTQAAVEVPATIMADGALNCAIERCEIAHIGTYAIWFRRGCKDGRIQRNRLFDLGAGGIRVGEDKMAKTDVAESSRILVDNNHLYNGGRIYHGCVGIWVAQSSGNRISHNDIHDFYYTGISIGWNWGLEPNRTSNNVIELNHVHDLGHGVMSDAGLIYCLGVSPGSVIRNNIFHDMWPYSKPALGWGIYLDAQCGNYLVESNLVYNTYSGGLMFNNGGHEHVIRNNIFALSATHALWPYSEKRPSTFRRNIVYLTQGELFIPMGEHSLNQRINAKEPLGDWDENLYWHTGGIDELRFYRRSFAEWQALGLDAHSRIADPQFVNPAKHDFRLKPSSPAFALGFQPLDLAQAGLYGDAEWVDEASHRYCKPNPLPPLPKPKMLELNDDFEQTPVGQHPQHAIVSGEEQGASITITAERAATGKHSLKIQDSKTLKPSWQPHFYYEPHIKDGTVMQSFECWISTNAQFFTEWRDSAPYPKNIGPSVRFDGDGSVTAGGRTLARLPTESWNYVEIEMTLGKDAPRVFQLTLKPARGPAQTFKNIPISGTDFHQLHWLGFSSTAASDTTFYLDNLKLRRTAPPNR